MPTVCYFVVDRTTPNTPQHRGVSRTVFSETQTQRGTSVCVCMCVHYVCRMGSTRDGEHSQKGGFVVHTCRLLWHSFQYENTLLQAPLRDCQQTAWKPACAPPQTTCPLREHPEATPGSSCRGHLPGGRGQALAFIHLLRAVATPAVPGVPAVVLKGGSVAVVVI